MPCGEHNPTTLVGGQADPRWVARQAGPCALGWEPGRQVGGWALSVFGELGATVSSQFVDSGACIVLLVNSQAGGWSGWWVEQVSDA